MIKRREFIAGLGSVAAWPIAARAQAAPPPVIGYLAQGTPEGSAEFVAALRNGLGEAGLVEGKGFTNEFRWARFDVDLLPGLVADLVQRRVAVIITLDTVPAARAAKAATTKIPIVFALGKRKEGTTVFPLVLRRRSPLRRASDMQMRPPPCPW